jgi:hypothetical protein
MQLFPCPALQVLSLPGIPPRKISLNGPLAFLFYEMALHAQLVRRVKSLAWPLPVRLSEFQNFFPSDIQRAPLWKIIPAQGSVLGVALHLQVYTMEIIPCVSVMRPKETKQRAC